METLKIYQSVPLERVADLLCSALEGGSNYWYEITEKIEPKNWVIDQRPVMPTEAEAVKMEKYHYLQYYPVNEGGVLIFRDKEGDNQEKKYFLTLATIQTGLQIMATTYPRHFANFISEQDDANTADVFLQCCLFGEVVYG